MLSVLLLALALPSSSTGKRAEASVPLDVPPGEFKSVRLQDIPASTSLAVTVRSDGPVAIWLLDEADYARFPTPRRPAFRGATSDRLSAEVRAPTTDHYYVVIDNRSGTDARSVDVTVRAETDDAGAVDPSLKLAEFRDRLGLLLRFESFPLRLGACSPGRSFDEAGGVLCEAYVARVREEIGAEAAQEALLFALFHEMGHVLLRQWDHPTHASEATADEFATVLTLLLGRDERARAQAELFDAQAERFAAIAAAFPIDRHPLSASRAREVVARVRDPELLERWQTTLVPRMQTEVLERLRREPLAWTDLALVEAELARRRSARE